MRNLTRSCPKKWFMIHQSIQKALITLLTCSKIPILFKNFPKPYGICVLTPPLSFSPKIPQHLRRKNFLKPYGLGRSFHPHWSSIKPFVPCFIFSAHLHKPFGTSSQICNSVLVSFDQSKVTYSAIKPSFIILRILLASWYTSVK